MFTLAIIGLIVLLVVVYPRIQERREAEAAERMEKLRDPAAASAEIDRLMATSRHEADFFSRLRDHR